MNARHDASHEHDTSPTGKPDVPKPAGGGLLNLVLHRLLAWRPGGYLRASGSLFGWLLLRDGAREPAALPRLLGMALKRQPHVAERLMMTMRGEGREG